MFSPNVVGTVNATCGGWGNLGGEGVHLNLYLAMQLLSCYPVVIQLLSSCYLDRNPTDLALAGVFWGGRNKDSC